MHPYSRHCFFSENSIIPLSSLYFPTFILNMKNLEKKISIEMKMSKAFKWKYKWPLNFPFHHEFFPTVDSWHHLVNQPHVSFPCLLTLLTFAGPWIGCTLPLTCWSFPIRKSSPNAPPRLLLRALISWTTNEGQLTLLEIFAERWLVNILWLLSAAISKVKPFQRNPTYPMRNLPIDFCCVLQQLLRAEIHHEGS